MFFKTSCILHKLFLITREGWAALVLLGALVVGKEGKEEQSSRAVSAGKLQDFFTMGSPCDSYRALPDDCSECC